MSVYPELTMIVFGRISRSTTIYQLTDINCLALPPQRHLSTYCGALLSRAQHPVGAAKMYYNTIRKSVSATANYQPPGPFRATATV